MSDRPVLEVADVIRAHGEQFQQQCGATLTTTQRQALRDLAVCRTAALGGHVERCVDCGHERLAYNSCRNRHCPKCQATARAVWLEREASYLLPVDYYHVVFTLPPAVAEVALVNPTVVYQLLFRAAADTVQAVAADPKHLGAQVGLLAVLHTWGQNLHHHPHLHCVATGGGLSCNRRGVVDAEPRWLSCRPGFFLPVRVLGRVFRGKFLAGLRDAFDQQRLRFPGRLAGLAAAAAFSAWLRPLYQSDWVVYAKPPFGGPAQVLKYLARYTHRVALSNHRLVSLEDGRVTFRYQDYADDARHKLLTLDAVEFLRRFVQHVLPKGFVKIRHYGLLANRQRAAKLTTCRQLLLVVTVATLLTSGASDGNDGSVVPPAARPHCPACGSERLEHRPLHREQPRRPAGLAERRDTS
jgi:predicted Zn-ribbon and HTH transcriptional regulator